MPRTFEWLSCIKFVEKEFKTARYAADRLLSEATQDPTVLNRDVSLCDIRDTLERLDGTYVIRLFAEFEAGLRQFWLAVRGTDSPFRTRDLLDGVAATRKIPFDQLAEAHKVREYRNDLIHERDGQSVPIPVADAWHSLCHFFSFLPPNW